MESRDEHDVRKERIEDSMIRYYEDTIMDLSTQPHDGQLDDLSPMPFGKHKGVPMQDVPAPYLHWFFTTCRANNPNSIKVMDYIRRNLVALRQEFKDGIWTRDKQLDS